MLHSGACKEATGITRLPLLAIRAPTNSARELALGMALAAAFGIVPRMTGAALRVWLVHEMARDGVACLLIDDAQELTLDHLALLKELTDNLAAPPYQRQVGLCLVAAGRGNVLPFREVLVMRSPISMEAHSRSLICRVRRANARAVASQSRLDEDLSSSGGTNER